LPGKCEALIQIPVPPKNPQKTKTKKHKENPFGALEKAMLACV
jgi:hypothetical protein